PMTRFSGQARLAMRAMVGPTLPPMPRTMKSPSSEPSLSESHCGGRDSSSSRTSSFSMVAGNCPAATGFDIGGPPLIKFTLNSFAPLPSIGVLSVLLILSLVFEIGEDHIHHMLLPPRQSLAAGQI